MDSPRLELDGSPVQLERSKALALLVYLAVSRQSHSRQALATLFWPDYDQSKAYAYLRRTLFSLNSTLGEGWIDAGRENLSLQPGADLRVDVVVFQRLLGACSDHAHPPGEDCADCRLALEAAAGLYHGDFLAGFSLRDSPAFDDWQFFQAEELRRQLAGVLKRLVDDYNRERDWDGAIASGRRWLALDPLQEEVHRRLMLLYGQAGQGPAALRQYQECARILSAELGVEPGSETQALKGCALLLEGGSFPDGGINFSSHARHSETCITGMVLSILAHFRFPDPRLHAIAEHLLGQQMPDGGWNCRSYNGDTHSSFKTTILALEGLREYSQVFPERAAVVSAVQAGGRKFLLAHKLYRSHRTDEVVSASMTRFPYPPHWQYDALRGLDYFQSVKAERDERMADAIALLEQKRKADGRWSNYRGPSGLVFFDLEPAGEPGRGNTLRALRVLRRWDGDNLL